LAENTVDRVAALAVVVIMAEALVVVIMADRVALAGMALVDPDSEGHITDLDLVLEDMVSLGLVVSALIATMDPQVSVDLLLGPAACPYSALGGLVPEGAFENKSCILMDL
jgi:hypothetical protein